MTTHTTMQKILFSTFFSLVIGFFPSTIFSQVKPGIEVLVSQYQYLIEGKRVGLITNPTGVTSDLASTIDVLHNLPNVRLVALFGPEHGVRGDAFAGEKVNHSVDRKTGIPIYSLYNGPMAPPTPEMLQNIEVLIYDIQDIGSRPYTYIYTLALAMQGAAQAGIRVVVLDRPDPLGGDLIEGPVLDERFKSGIGMYPIPYIYGLTVGELARFFNEEFGIHAHLTVVPMEGWQRSMLFADTGLSWVLPSPHVPHPKTALYIAATGSIGELQSLSTGVGYTLPFELVGQTWIDPENLAAALNSRNLPGVRFRPLYFRPYYFGHKDKQLAGAQIHLTNPREFRPVLTQLHILSTLLKL
ncbi:MAG: exo-beta-N-acetylmuramidase NamZ family protein, partial [bacterium]